MTIALMFANSAPRVPLRDATQTFLAAKFLADRVGISSDSSSLDRRSGALPPCHLSGCTAAKPLWIPPPSSIGARICYFLMSDRIVQNARGKSTADQFAGYDVPIGEPS